MDNMFLWVLIAILWWGFIISVIYLSVKKDLNLKWIAWYTAIILTIMHALPAFNAHISGELWHTPTLIFMYWLLLKKKI